MCACLCVHFNKSFAIIEAWHCRIQQELKSQVRTLCNLHIGIEVIGREKESREGDGDRERERERDKERERGEQLEVGLGSKQVGRCSNSVDTKVFLRFKGIVNNTGNSFELQKYL